MKYIIILIVIFGAFGCTEESINKEPLTYENFSNRLDPEMNYTSFVDIFGEPAEDIGSGIHIYVYKLADLTEIWIGYADGIVYARHIDQNEQLLDTII